MLHKEINAKNRVCNYYNDWAKVENLQTKNIIIGDKIIKIW